MFTAERPKGPETYGAFVIAVRVRDATGATLIERTGDDLAGLSREHIINRWPVAVHAGAHALVFPLGGRASITLPSFDASGLGARAHLLELEDVSGARWTEPLRSAGPCDDAAPACEVDVPDAHQQSACSSAARPSMRSCAAARSKARSGARDQGTRVAACGLSLAERHVAPESLTPLVEIVPNALAETLVLQAEGYVSVEL